MASNNRTKSALRARKAARVRLGRPEWDRKLDEMRDETQRCQKLGINKAAIAKLLGCPRSAYLHWLVKEGAT